MRLRSSGPLDTRRPSTERGSTSRYSFGSSSSRCCRYFSPRCFITRFARKPVYFAFLGLVLFSVNSVMKLNSLHYLRTNKAGSNSNSNSNSNNNSNSNSNQILSKQYASNKYNFLVPPTHPNFLPRVLAFVFPQFHQDPINDNIWGVGFTDWDNLKNAPQTNRLGFKIPRPTELGYYDYTDIKPRKLQGELAREYGIDGFLFHHYWFYDVDHPGPTLHAPLIKMLEDGHPNLPFAFNWANQNWVKTWSGVHARQDFKFKEPDLFQKQYYPTNQDYPTNHTDNAITDHYRWLRQFFHHPNYIKVDGKPFVMVYQNDIDCIPVLLRLKELAIEDGFPGMFFTAGIHANVLSKFNYHTHLEVPPNENIAARKAETQKYSYIYDLSASYPFPKPWLENFMMKIPEWCKDDNKLYDKTKDALRLKEISGIIPSFDNTPRRDYQEARIWSPMKPDKAAQKFEENLYTALYYESCCFPEENELRMKKSQNDDDRFILVNAMNEWAEGMALEPSDVYGRKFLEAVRNAKNRVVSNNCRDPNPNLLA